MVKALLAQSSRFPYRAATRIAFAVGLLAFVLPFASVSCGGSELFTARGVNAAIGGQYKLGGEQVYFYSGDPYFLVAAVAAILALAFQFLRRYMRVSLVASAVAGLVSVVAMLIAQAHVNSRIGDLHASGAVSVKYGIGYWIALFAFGVGTVVAAVEVYRVMRLRSHSNIASGQEPPTPAVLAGGVVAMVGSLVVIAACAIPNIHYKTGSAGFSGDPTTSPSVFAPGFGASNWFAAEPVAVAVLAFVAGAVLIEWSGGIPRALAAGVLLAYGVQTFFLFIGYVALAMGSPDAQLRPGGIVGAFGGVLLLAAGLAALNLSRQTPQNAVALVRSWVPRKPATGGSPPGS